MAHSPRQVVIGVDVGGTNIDAVALAGAEKIILSTFKAPTTPDPSEGIVQAIASVIEGAKLSKDEISSIVIGTTHFINAVLTLDASRLDRVAVVRLGHPYTAACPPFINFPMSLRRIVEGPFALCQGGVQINGRLIGKVDCDEISKTVCPKIEESGVRAVVVTGIYSMLNDGQQEKEAADIIRKHLPDVDVICTSDIGTDGLLEREGAAVLNASLLRFARRTLRAFQQGVHQQLGLPNCPLFLTQNDGTLCSLRRAAVLPIRTFSSGATNSMRGASYLGSIMAEDSKMSNGTALGGDKPVIVIDVGGTTTDVGVLLPSGFPRQAAAFVTVGGVRTRFSMPDVLSVGLGGGSLVSEPDEIGKVEVGPASSGYRLLQEALVFGGSVCTATDIAVAAGRAPGVGDASLLRQHTISDSKIAAALATIKRKLEGAIASIKTWPEPATLLVVGGGAILIPDKLHGVERIVRPPHFDCANAVGAAVARVSAEINSIRNLPIGSDFATMLAPLKEQAARMAVDAGANADSVQIVEVQHLPVQYVATGATKIFIRAAGDLEFDRVLTRSSQLDFQEHDEKDLSAGQAKKTSSAKSFTPEYITIIKEIDEWTLEEVVAYRPIILAEDKSWSLTELDLYWIAEGAGVLGVGGGGSTYPIMIMCREVLRKGGRIRIISLDNLPADALVGRCMMMGSPSVSDERLQAGPELADSIKTLMEHMRIPLEKIVALVDDEIGGGNGIQPALAASSDYLDIPLVDADLMGRAYPFLFCTLPVAFNIPGHLPPAAVVDGQGNRCIVVTAGHRQGTEELLRVVCDKIGSMGMYSGHPLTVQQIREYGVQNSYSQCWRLGRAMHLSRLRNDLASLPASLFALQAGRVLFTGKCIEVYRHIKNAWTFGHLRIRPLESNELEHESTSTRSLDEDCGQEIQEVYMEFQNEYLFVQAHRADGTKRIIATVPDLITILDSQSGTALGTHEICYGLRLTVIALACDEKWTTPEGLAMGGPEVWDLQHTFVTTVGAYRTPNSVIREYESEDRGRAEPSH